MDGVRFVLLEAGIHVSTMSGEALQQVKELLNQHPARKRIYILDVTPANGWEFGIQWTPWVGETREVCLEVFESILEWITNRLTSKDTQNKGPGFWEFSRCPVEDWMEAS